MKRLLLFFAVAPIVVLVVVSSVMLLARGDMSKPQSHRLKKYEDQKDLVLSKAVVDEPTFDFGIMDPLTMGHHKFVFRNEGKAPLELELGATTCKCTLGKLEDSAILPGEQGEVTLSWNTGRKFHVYSHGATIHTNDPKRSRIDLRVQGYVRVQLGFEPKEVVFSRVIPDTTPTADVVVYSQDWDNFTIENVTSSLEGVDWKIEPIESPIVHEK